MFKCCRSWIGAHVVDHLRPAAAGADSNSLPVADAAAVARARASFAGRGMYPRVARLFGALADPTRARLVDTLLREELCTGDLAAVLGVSMSGVSQHLRVLRDLRLVKSRRAGKFVYHTLDDEHVAQLMALGLTHAGHFAGATGTTPTTPTTHIGDGPPAADSVRSVE